MAQLHRNDGSFNRGTTGERATNAAPDGFGEQQFSKGQLRVPFGVGVYQGSCRPRI
jgi:hypothetical protein